MAEIPENKSWQSIVRSAQAAGGISGAQPAEMSDVDMILEQSLILPKHSGKEARIDVANASKAFITTLIAYHIGMMEIDDVDDARSTLFSELLRAEMCTGLEIKDNVRTAINAKICGLEIRTTTKVRARFKDMDIQNLPRQMDGIATVKSPNR